MKITVLGANGKIGSIVVSKLLSNGYEVVAFVHGNTVLPVNPALQIVQGNIYDPKSVKQAITGSDLVISTLGSWGTPKKDILSVGMGHVIPIMEKLGIKQIISLTGADSNASGDPQGLMHRLMHTIFLFLAKKIMLDGEKHISLLENSQLNWTIIRSPVMSDSGDPTKYKLSSKRPMPWETINRLSVADSIVNQINDATYIKQSPFIHRI